jgi:hypothetical protein
MEVVFVGVERVEYLNNYYALLIIVHQMNTEAATTSA